uniref:Putative capsid protein n=1 Tax=viral metagenome TaxID=1070528 RepID=A0A6M3JTP3_9ZZZZ
MPAGPITTGAHPKALWPGVWNWFGASYDEHPEEFSQVFDVETSTKNFEEDVQMNGFGLAPVKNQSKGVDYVGHVQGWVKRYIPVVYGLGYIVTREELDDNLYEEVSRKRAQALAFAMRQTKEIVHANVLNRATTAAYTGGDGSVLMVATHPSDAGTWSNILAPAADISEDALEDLCTQVMGFTDNQGNKINLMPRCVIVPRQLWFETNRILYSALQNDTANNALNVLKSTSALPDGIKMNHYLTDTDAYFVKTNCPRGLISVKRRAIEFTKDNEFSTENALAKATERYDAGWTDPRCLCGSPGA